MPQSTFTETSANEHSSSTGRFKPLVSLYRHKGLAILIFLIVSLVGLPIAWLKGKPSYETSAIILVSPKFTPNLEEKGLDLRGNDYNLYIAEQQGMLRRDDIIREVLELPKIKEIWVRPDDVIQYPESPERASVERLQMAISTKNKRGSPYIAVEIAGSKKEGLALTLNTLVDLYLQKSQAENFFDSGGRISALNERKNELQQLIIKKQQERTQIAERLGVTTFQEGSLNPYDKILIDATSNFKTVQRQRAEAQAQLNALTEGEKGQTALDALVRELVANDNVLTGFKAKLIDRRTELSSQILELTPQHPSRQRIEREITKIDQDIAQATEKLYLDIRERLLDKHRVDLHQAMMVEKALENELDKQQEQATLYATQYNKAIVLTKEIDRAYRQIDAIDNRVDFLTIESEAPGYTRWYARAKTPLYPSGAGRRKIFMIFLILAFGLGVSTPIVIDLLDRRIQTPAEVKKILGFSPLAWILERKDSASWQLTVDQLRRLALALDRDWHNHNTSFFALTAVKAGGGTTTLVLELAHHLTLLGVRTLALEMNAFKPDSRYNGDIPGLGLTFLLNQHRVTRDMLETAIVPATAELPDRLPMGDNSQRHLATSGRLLPLLKQLNQLYDLIILDSPPILLSADAELLGKIEGGILLVIEAGHTTPGELKRAASLLEHLTPPVVAAVVNHVHIFYGGGYFAELLKEYNTGAKLRRSWFKRWLWG